MTRRASYSARMWSPDFLIVRHVAGFAKRHVDSIVERARVLDAGCGEQPLRRQVEQKGATYIALDIEQNEHGTVDIVAALWDVPLPDGVVDVILATEVVEHVADTAGAFREMTRLLARDGRIILTMPFCYPLHEEPHDYIRLTPSGLQWYAVQNSLEVEELTVAGTEIEAIALILSNAIGRAGANRPPWVRILALAMKVPLVTFVNVIALALNAAFGTLMPQKMYLSTMAVLRRATEA